MNLLEIIQTYLSKPLDEGDAFLEHLVANAGMPNYLVKHIQGCRKDPFVVRKSDVVTSYIVGSQDRIAENARKVQGSV